MTIHPPEKYGTRPPLPKLLRRPLRRQSSDDPDHEDQTYTFDVTIVDPNGKPVAGIELSIINNNNGTPSSRYTDGNGFCNHALIGRPDDLCTFQTNGAKIVSATGAPPAGAQYLYLPSGTAHVTVQLSLESFKQGLRPSPVVPRGPLPPFPTPLNYRTTLPWTPPIERDFCRGDAWGVEMPGAPQIPGTGRKYERIFSWFLDRYSLDFQREYLTKYAGYGYTHLKLSLADSCGKVDNGSASPPGAGRTLDQFIETCALVKQYVPWCQVMLGSKYFSDFEGRLAPCPNYMSGQQWADWSGPILEKLIAAKVLDECIAGWEWNLWNNPGKDSIDAYKFIGAMCHAAGVSSWQHMAPHYTSWQADGDERGRFGWFDDLAGYLDGINYQTMGPAWSAKMLQDRMVDTLWVFGDRGNDFKMRMDEDYAFFMWDSDEWTGVQDDIPGNIVTMSCTPDDANQRSYIGCCTVDDVKHGDARIWGYMNGGRRPDGSRL